MNKKLKLALAALLGFSTACSTVKNTPAGGETGQEREAGAQEIGDSVSHPRIIVMYGVRYPGRDEPVVAPSKESGVRVPDARQSGAADQTPDADAQGSETPAAKTARE